MLDEKCEQNSQDSVSPASPEPAILQSAYDYVNKSDKYFYGDDDFTDYYERQFYHIYRARTREMIPRILESAKAQLDSSVKITPLSSIENDVSALVAGVVIKHMMKQPTLLKGFDEAIEDENGDEPSSVILPTVDENPETLATDLDYLELEDEQNQVVTLSGDIDHQLMTSGMVIGLFGKKQNNQFHVQKIIYPQLTPYIKRPLLTKDLYIAFISGLMVTSERVNAFISMPKLAFALSCAPFFGNVARIVVAGNSSVTFCTCDNCKKVSINNVMPLGLTLDAVKNPMILDVVRNLEKNLVRFDIDIMPGVEDPCGIMLPQQPLPRFLLERYVPSNEYDSDINVSSDSEDLSDCSDEEMINFVDSNINVNMPMPIRRMNAVTNPYSFNVEGFEVHGTSGQNVDGIAERTRHDRSSVDILEQLLKLGHVVPTAPDSTDCFPYSTGSKNSDPFVLDNLPHIFFAGNQRHYATKIIDFGDDRRVCLVSIPRYVDSNTFVVVNLRTLEASEVLLNN